MAHSAEAVRCAAPLVSHEHELSRVGPGTQLELQQDAEQQLSSNGLFSSSQEMGQTGEEGAGEEQGWQCRVCALLQQRAGAESESGQESLKQSWFLDVEHQIQAEASVSPEHNCQFSEGPKEPTFPKKWGLHSFISLEHHSPRSSWCGKRSAAGLWEPERGGKCSRNCSSLEGESEAGRLWRQLSSASGSTVGMQTGSRGRSPSVIRQLESQHPSGWILDICSWLSGVG